MIRERRLNYLKPQKTPIHGDSAKKTISALENRLANQETIVLSGTGSGELYSAKEFAAQSGRPSAVLTCTAALGTEDINGHFVASQEGEGFDFQESLIKTTAEANGIVILDSPSLLSIECQDQVADLVKKNPAAKFIALMNPTDPNGQLTDNLIGALRNQ